MMTARLFSNGNSQAVRLPKEMRFDGSEVYVHKIGDSVMLVPKDKALSTFLESLSEFTNDYFEALDSRPKEIESEREKL
ncbi:antitoxin [Ruminococcus albus]|jgi:antitoxin VapB|uniref:SpoVT/AbrB-like protein n=1 Tax=Ruminococcus albus 8 TaxID=246199 RepID=E9SBN6_RUMAL|nr:type II toxin-antitoxin system VapB family antitoxin [Ruminococcus albus]EGC03311.1 SpoVT/AbrB-like protein [Ruminococcus albus 8]MCC3351789.1 type II toxin-antitoxin system VapB family antitoxin [Ruminococcus albus 8]